MCVCVCVLCVYVWCECGMVKLDYQFEELCSFDGFCPEVGWCQVSGSLGAVEEVCSGVFELVAERQVLSFVGSRLWW